jgi:hypothetical protein
LRILWEQEPKKEKKKLKKIEEGKTLVMKDIARNNLQNHQNKPTYAWENQKRGWAL